MGGWSIEKARTAIFHRAKDIGKKYEVWYTNVFSYEEGNVQAKYREGNVRMEFDDNKAPIFKMLIKNDEGKLKWEKVTGKLYDAFTDAWEAQKKRALKEAKQPEGWIPEQSRNFQAAAEGGRIIDEYREKGIEEAKKAKFKKINGNWYWGKPNADGSIRVFQGSNGKMGFYRLSRKGYAMTQKMLDKNSELHKALEEAWSKQMKSTPWWKKWLKGNQ